MRKYFKKSSVPIMPVIIADVLIVIAVIIAFVFAKPKEEKTELVREAYLEISQEEAKRLMDSGENYYILDARTEEEYAEGHIGNAILIPETEVKEKAPELLPDKDRLVLVYCRSGNRSKIAAKALVEMGYTYVREFGGIRTWPYEIITD
ncbi:MAG: rhodanese-like domain-containing protein [Oscillospiraceae bacterium]|nr:rhodanese-like domain-containing protein [Oscillospiraceae bacterium]